MKYGMWLDEWFRNYIQPSSKIKTCERYSEIIEKHLKVKLGEYELDELTPLVLQRYVTGLMQSGNIVTGKGLAANSVNGIITVIQNSLKLAYTLGELKEYTADKIKRPKTKEKEVSCFSLAEQKKIEQAALSSKKRKFIGIVICLYSGLRIGELLALTWSDIDFTKGTLAVNKTCHDGRDEKGNLCRITDLPKTASSKRMIPLPKQLLPVLKEYKRKSISEYVVESENGEPPTVRSYQRTFELLQKRLHIERKGFHSLRYKDIKPIMADLKKVYGAVNEEAALYALEEFKEKWDSKYPQIYKMWESNWTDLSGFFKYPTEMRRLIYTTNAVEGFHRMLRKFTKTKTNFPTDDSLKKSIYLSVKEISKKWNNPVRDWGKIIGQFMMFFEERFGEIRTA